VLAFGALVSSFSSPLPNVFAAHYFAVLFAAAGVTLLLSAIVKPLAYLLTASSICPARFSLADL
jgi:hypothetical protein